MRIFKKNIFLVFIYLSIFTFIISGCNEISQGLQRKKFEFLYKMNNYASLFREYTGGISYSEDLDIYEKRMSKLYEDVSKMEDIDGYKTSDELKDKFLIVIQENIRTADIIRQKKMKPDENIRNDIEVMLMNDRTDNFIEELNEEISKVGKEQ